MSLSETWVCVDEDRNETVHTSVPYYNQLQRRWKSDYYIYVNRGFVSMVVPSETWVCVDEDRNETVHTSVPYYNQLQRRWKSDYYIYVNRGFVSMVVPSNILLSVAAAYNINPLGTNKITSVLKGKL